MNKSFITILTLLLLATTARSSAQTSPREEQLQEVVVLGKQKLKKLIGRGTRVPGAIVQLTPNQVGHEIGSAVTITRPTEVREITFDILSCSIKDAVLSIDIYRDSSYTKVLESPILIPIPQEKKQTIIATPHSPTLLAPGRYIITVTFAHCCKETQELWAHCDHWDAKQRYTITLQSSIQFPLYTKESYIRNGTDDTFEKRNLNIGLKVKGIRSTT